MNNSVESLNPEKYAEMFQNMREEILKDPIKHFIRSPGFMNFLPTPAQTVALKIIFGQRLDDLKKYTIHEECSQPGIPFSLREVQLTETEIYRMMTGFDYDGDLQKARSRISMIIGRRGGKTTLAAMLGIFGAIKTNWRPFLTKTPTATIAILSHTRELSEEILNLLRQLVEDSEVLCRLIDTEERNTQSTFNLKIPFFEVNAKGEKVLVYSSVTIKVGAASKKTIRGRAICVLLCDEIAFWGTEQHSAEKDEDILRAATPSLLQFQQEGLLIKLSSPGIKQGVLYSEYLRRNELPKSHAVFKAPSWVWNTILKEKDFLQEYTLDPSGFASEFRADFVDSISNFFSPEYVSLCTLKGATFCPPESKKEDVSYSAAIDAAFKGDRFTFTVVGGVKEKIKQYVMKDWAGSPTNPVKAYEVAEFVSNICGQYGINQVHADQFAFQPLREIFEKYGVTLVENTFTQNYKKQIYFNLKSLIHNQKVDLLDHQLQITEIKQLQVEQTSTGSIRIGHPPGGHDDCADALAIACYILVKTMSDVGMDFGEVAGNTYGIQLDQHGKTFVAPPPDMLFPQIDDNSSLYERDPKTGEYHLIEDDDDDDDGPNFSFA